MEFDMMDVDQQQLGWYENDDFIISDDAQEILEETYNLILKENVNTRDVRRRLHRGQFMKKELIPFVNQLEDESKLFHCCIKVMLHLTQPLECLGSNAAFSTERVMAMEMKNLLKQAKSEFVNPKLIRTILKEIQFLLDQSDQFTLAKQDCETINNCLLLFRNIFYIAENNEVKSAQSQIVWILLKEGFPDLFKNLMSNAMQKEWSASIVQLISLLYKDESAVTLILALSLSSNTNAQPSGMEAPKQADKKMMEDSSEDTDSDSDCDNNITYHVDDQIFQQINESTDNHVSKQNLNKALANFAVIIIKHGFKNLVMDLYDNLMSPQCRLTDESYLTWFLSFFLKFAFLPGVEYQHISDVISRDIVSYLTFKGVQDVEEFIASSMENKDADLQAMSIRKVHLVVMALREIFHGINYFSTCVQLNSEDKIKLRESQFEIASLQDLQRLFVFLIRSCPLVEPFRIYLRDVVTTNHVFLLLIEQLLTLPSESSKVFKSKFSMLQHVNLFANKSIARCYGFLLETYDTNSPCINECIMTMLHHIAGDCNKPEVLLQLPILNTFMDMYERNFPMSTGSTELIEHVLCKFEATCKQTDIKSEENTVEKSAEHDYISTGTLGSQNNSVETLNGDQPLKDLDNPILRSLLNVEAAMSHEDYINSLNQNLSHGIHWIKHVLLEACYVKLSTEKNADIEHLEEPVSYHYSALDQSIPLVPFTLADSDMLGEDLFLLLLRQMGFYFPEGKGHVFPRIPSSWTADEMFQMAKFLDSKDDASPKFTEEDLRRVEQKFESSFYDLMQRNPTSNSF